MREIFKPQVQEFHDGAYLDLYCMGEDGSGPSPMPGDRFFLVEPDESQLIMWSTRMEEFYSWHFDGYWSSMFDSNVPKEIQQAVLKKVSI